MTDTPEKPGKKGEGNPAAPTEAGNGCRRCGTCCRKGGPALHTEDVELVRSGVIGLESLFTIRAGERVHDNVRDRVVSLQNEIVKIKGIGGSWTCLFYDSDTAGCRIYRQRPLECRALACWDPAELEHIYQQDRITREDLIGSIRGLWDLVQAHESRCSQEKLAGMISKLKIPLDPFLTVAIRECIGYDHHLRQLTVEKSGIAPALLDFLFGRPLQETVKMHGITVTKSGNRLQLRFNHLRGSSS
jgi:Fe-S-cluster containining protein